TENIEYVLKGLSKLMFVEISLDREKDDPQRIFESLNSTGLELSQADLIRNYILMGLNRKSQNKIYSNYWEIIEKLAKDESLNTSKVSDFIRDYLTLVNNKIPNKSKVYLEFKNKFPTSDLEELENNLLPIKSLAKYYNKLLNPKNESDREIRTQLEYINRLEVNVAFPFLMKVYEDYSENIIDKQTFIKVLDFIQSFAWRRFILGLPTNALNKIFMTLYEKIDKNNYLVSLQKWLLKRPGSQRFPKNNELIESLKLKDVYSIKSKNRTYLLERLENFENKEPVKIEGNTDITIEHIFPQNPDPKWKVDLGTDEYNFIKETYLNTIGNLTLSGNNGKLGNKIFTYKRDLENAGYKDSRLWLNKYLSIAEKWDKAEIERRFNLLAERFLKIWEYPAIDLGDRDENNEVNIFEAEDPKHKKLEYAIFYDQKIEVTQVSKLYVEVFKQLFDLQPETFFTTDLAEKITLTKNPKEGNPRQAVQINETYFIEGNIDNIGKFEKIKHALTVFDSEDELAIKYAEK
ncbi:MAG: HNH endonuclease family protein, partial [Polaribacter sp.]